MPHADYDNKDTVRDAQPPAAPASSGGRRRLFLIIAAVVLIGGGIVASVIAFDLLPLTPDSSATPQPTPTTILSIAEFDACGRILATFPSRFCYDEQVETDATWRNSSLLADEQITDELATIAVGIPGARWIIADNPQQPIEKIFYLPEGDTVAFAQFILDVAATEALASITINGEIFEQGESFRDEQPPFFVSLLSSRPVSSATPSAEAQQIDARDLLLPGRNIIQFTFAQASAAPATPTPEPAPETAEATAEASASASSEEEEEEEEETPLPAYALLAQLRVPTTAEYSTLVSETIVTDSDWLDAPYAGFLPDSDPDVLDGALWIQGADNPDDMTVSVEHSFYVPENEPSYFINVHVREATLDQIIITNADGETRELDWAAHGTPTEQGDGFSYQPYGPIPFSGATSSGLNRIEIVYAPNSNNGHYIRAAMAHPDDVVAVTDASWLRGSYRVQPTNTEDALVLAAQVARGDTRLRGFVGIPDVVGSERAAGTVRITCVEIDVLCDNLRLSYDNTIRPFSTANPVVITQPNRLFTFDAIFLSDNLATDTARIGLEIIYEEGDTRTNLATSSMWYGYRPVTILESIPAEWATLPESAFIQSTFDNGEGAYISVFETQLLLPENTVVVASDFRAVSASVLLAVEINGTRTYQTNDLATGDDTRQVITLPLDQALLRGGENRIVIYNYNRGGLHAVSFTGRITYFQRQPEGTANTPNTQ